VHGLAAHDHGCRAVTKQDGRNKVCLGDILALKRQGRQLYSDDQHIAAGLCF
jgi:hypothetical protein